MFEFLKKSRVDEEIGKVLEIPIDCIASNPQQSRRYIDNASLVKLSRSIKRHGIIQPITVREVEEGIYELISGERRVRAAAVAGFEYIPAIVMNIDNKRSALFSLLENLQRDDLCFFEIAQNYKDLLKKQNMTIDEIAEALGVDKNDISNKIRLLRMSPRVKKLLRDYNFTERQAKAIMSLPTEELRLDVIRQVYRRRLNVYQTEEMVDRIIKKNISGEGFHDRYCRELRNFEERTADLIDDMRKKGIDAAMKQNIYDWGTEYIIRVPKIERE